MKSILKICLICILASPLYAQDDSHICKDLSHLIEMEASHHEKILNFRSSGLTDNYDLKYHRLEWEIDPNSYYIKGNVTSYFEAVEDDFRQINFDLDASMTINKVTYHGMSLSYNQLNNNILQIDLPATVAVGQLDSIGIAYEGIPASTGFGSFNQASHNNNPIIWTLSEPYGAKEWWPCKQDLNDKIDSIDVIVTTPADYRVASNGLLHKELENGATKTYHWKHRYPIPAYLIAVAVTNYAVYSDYVPVDGGSDIEVLNYVYPENLISAQNETQSIVEIMTLFNDLFGLYPFAEEKYGHAQFEWGGGMEHQTMSFMSNFSYNLQAHELAHQWFGDKVTCGSWEDIWLNEGFATYLTGLTKEHLDTPEEWYNWKAGRISSITSRSSGSVWVDDTTSVNRIFSGRLTYNKGAMLLHMLRWKMGDDDFFQAVRNYVDKPKLAFAYARTADLQAELESQSGQDLDPFFADWFYGEGFPSYQIGWRDEADGLFLRINQTSSHSSVDFFEMPLPILVFGEGRDSLIRVSHDSDGQEYSIALPFAVDSIQFDPTLWLVSNNNRIMELSATAVTNLEKLGGLRMYPNPVNELLHIDIATQGVIDQVVLRNVLGKELKSWAKPGRNAEISLKGLPAGLYVVEVFAEGEILSGKVIKE